MAKNEAKIRFSAETSEFNDAIKSANQELQDFRAEMKLNEAEFQNTGDSAEYYQRKQELLQEALQANKDKQEALNQKIEVAKDIYGENSTEVQKLERELTYAKVQEQNLLSAVNDTNDGLNDQGAATSNASDNLQTLTDIEVAEFLGDIADKAMEAMEGMYNLADAAAGVTDRIDKQSQKLGISREAFQEWDYIMSQNGSSIDSMKSGMRKLEDAMDGITTKEEFASSAFSDLGMSFDDVSKMDKEDLFENTIKALQNIPDEVERNKKASEIFGKSYQELQPLLNQTADATEDLKQKAHDMGLVLEDDVVDAGVAFTDQMDTWNRTVDIVKTNIGIGLAGGFSALVSGIQPIIPYVQMVTDGFASLVQQSPILQAMLVGIGVAFGALAVALTITSLIKSVQTAFSLLNVTMMANPAVFIAAAIIGLGAAFLVAYKKSETFRNGVNAVVGFAKGAFVAGINIAKGAINGFTGMVTTAATKFISFKDKALGAITALKDGIKNKIDAIKSFFSNLVLKIPKPSMPKLPHFSLKTGQKTIFGKTITYPTGISVDWRARNYDYPAIYTRGTILPGTNGMIGVGDRGAYKGGEINGSVRDVSNMIESAVNRGMVNTIDYDRLGTTVAKAMSKMNMTIKLDEREIGRAFS